MAVVERCSVQGAVFLKEDDFHVDGYKVTLDSHFTRCYSIFFFDFASFINVQRLNMLIREGNALFR